MNDQPAPRSVLPQITEDVAAAAQHGTFCPKMCTFACPVATATGRDDAVPWSLHRTVDDLATGRLAPADVGGQLEGCTGCHACRDACTFDQDVPAQVRAGRAAVVAAGEAPHVTRQAVERAARGRSPFAVPRATTVAGDEAGHQSSDVVDVVVVAGCREAPATVAAHAQLLLAAGLTALHVAPAGCCGGALADLGALDAAAEREDDLAERLATIDAPLVVALDPHCLPSLRRAAGEAEVLDATSHLAALLGEGRLVLEHGFAQRVTFHDPCLLARDEGVVDAPRVLLRAAGLEVVEAAEAGTATRCSGGGMALPLLAPDDAGTTADRRAAQLRATGAEHTITACSGANRRLADAGLPVIDLYEALAATLPGSGDQP